MEKFRNLSLGNGKTGARVNPLLALLLVPPIIEGVLVGAVVRKLYRHTLEATSSELIERKTDIERLAQKIGNALALGVSLEETLNKIIDLALSIINVEHGIVALLEHGELRIVSSSSADISSTTIDTEQTAAGRALENKRPVIVDDLQQSTHILSPAREIAGLKSVLVAPIIIDNKGIGVIEVYSNRPGAFSDDDASVLFSFAKQATVAIKNARSVADLKSEADFRRTLSIITTSLLAAPNLNSLLYQLCEETTHAFNIDGTYIWRVEALNKRLVAFTAYGFRAELFMGRTFELDDPHSMAALAARERHTLTRNDIRLSEQKGELFMTFKPRSQAAIPIIVDDTVEAVMVLNDRSNPFKFDEQTTRKAEVLAGQAAIAISNSRLIDRLSNAEQILSSTLNSVNEGIFMVDENQNLLFINGAASHIFGVELTHFAGKAKRADIAPLIDKRIYEIEHYKEKIDCMYQDMERELIEEFETVDGKILQCYSRPVYRDNELLGRIEVYRDITSIKQAQKELALRARRSRAIAEIGRAASSSLELEEVLRTVVDQACQALDADKGSIFFYDEADKTLSGQVGYNMDEDEICTMVDRVIPGSQAYEAISNKAPVAVECAPGDARVEAERVERFSIKSVLAVPLLIRDRAIGLIFICFSRDFRHLTEEEIEFAQGIATQAAVAIENARLFKTERNISKTLQQALLPSATPEVPELDIGICYISATETALVGGDFYDFLPFPDGRFGFVIGDVSGKGVESATLTAMIKQSIRAFATEDPKPSNVIGRTNRATVWQIERGHFVTTFYALYDPNTGTIEYTNAGHPYPILIFNGHAETLAGSGMALGIRENERYRTYTRTLGPGYLLALYTDGVTEARHDSDFFGEERLMEALTEAAHLDATSLVNRTIGKVKAHAHNRLTDDIALMVLKRMA